MGPLLGSSMVGLMETPRGLMPQAVWPGSCTQSPCPCSRPLLTRTSEKTQTQVWLSLCGVSVSWCVQGFVGVHLASLAGIWFDSKCDFTPPTVLLGLLLCPWTWGISFWWTQHSPVDGCSAVSCNFGVLTGEDVLLLCQTVLILNLAYRWKIKDFYEYQTYWQMV